MAKVGGDSPMRPALSASGRCGCAHAPLSHGSLPVQLFCGSRKTAMWILPGSRCRVFGGHLRRCARRFDRRRHSTSKLNSSDGERSRYCFGNSIRTMSEFWRVRSKMMCLPSGVMSNPLDAPLVAKPCELAALTCAVRSSSQKSGDSGRGRYTRLFSPAQEPIATRADPQ